MLTVVTGEYRYFHPEQTTAVAHKLGLLKPHLEFDSLDTHGGEDFHPEHNTAVAHKLGRTLVQSSTFQACELIIYYQKLRVKFRKNVAEQNKT